MEEHVEGVVGLPRSGHCDGGCLELANAHLANDVGFVTRHTARIDPGDDSTVGDPLPLLGQVPQQHAPDRSLGDEGGQLHGRGSLGAERDGAAQQQANENQAGQDSMRALSSVETHDGYLSSDPLPPQSESADLTVWQPQSRMMVCTTRR